MLNAADTDDKWNVYSPQLQAEIDAFVLSRPDKSSKESNELIAMPQLNRSKPFPNKNRSAIQSFLGNMVDKKNNTRKRKRNATAAEPTIPVIQAEHKGEKSLVATSTRLSESDRKALTASERAMFAGVSSKGTVAKIRTALNPQRDLIQECANECIVNLISIGTSYMAVLYDSAGPAVAIPLRPLWRIGRLVKKPAKQG
ncbi:hypothetical protein FMUND_13432 [Fusarium mundagurra]|uniref:Uncharacterized protein n=1 Tax=Fusarium mundagurra TaxID=1567541 RepID=A0A8H5XYW5_9HYPO|nr:hypothetical protein FMUND_13432 [Fusarium mundagurra]